jgi:hypothetical protein
MAAIFGRGQAGGGRANGAGIVSLVAGPAVAASASRGVKDNKKGPGALAPSPVVVGLLLKPPVGSSGRREASPLACRL